MQRAACWPPEEDTARQRTGTWSHRGAFAKVGRRRPEPGRSEREDLYPDVLAGGTHLSYDPEPYARTRWWPDRQGEDVRVRSRDDDTARLGVQTREDQHSEADPPREGIY
jgi:hypothetical protein